MGGGAPGAGRAEFSIVSDEQRPRFQPALTMPPDAYDADGVDRTLTRASLRQTPTECLEILEEMLELAESVKRVDKSE